MVIGYHLIWTGYGWWLPNDPRGSMSKYVQSDVLAELGDLHYGRKRVQPSRRELMRFFEAAQPRLVFDTHEFDDVEIASIASAFAETLEREKLTCYACAIMPDHVYALVRKHKLVAEEMIDHLQRDSRDRLREEQFVSNDHPVWGGPGWTVFLDFPEEMRRTIRYIEQNPVKIGKPVQKWHFVKDYDDWPFHKGYKATSPWVQTMGNGKKRR